MALREGGLLRIGLVGLVTALALLFAVHFPENREKQSQVREENAPQRGAEFLAALFSKAYSLGWGVT